MSRAPAPGRRGVSVSLVIALLLATSGLVRLLGGTGAAIAREVASLAPETAAEPVTVASCPDAPELDRILETLKAREAALEEREARAEARTRELNEAGALISEQMAALEAAESELLATIADAEVAAETDIEQLTAVYENMKPKEAAAIFEQMDPEFAAGFLGRMRSDSAARIFAGLQPATAYTISAILASRNLDVPTR